MIRYGKEGYSESFLGLQVPPASVRRASSNPGEIIQKFHRYIENPQHLVPTLSSRSLKRLGTFHRDELSMVGLPHCVIVITRQLRKPPDITSTDNEYLRR